MAVDAAYDNDDEDDDGDDDDDVAHGGDCGDFGCA